MEGRLKVCFKSPTEALVWWVMCVHCNDEHDDDFLVNNEWNDRNWRSRMKIGRVNPGKNKLELSFYCNFSSVYIWRYKYFVLFKTSNQKIHTSLKDLWVCVYLCMLCALTFYFHFVPPLYYFLLLPFVTTIQVAPTLKSCNLMIKGGEK